MTTFTAGPWAYGRYGTVAFEVQGGGRAIAIVNRAAQNEVNHRERLNEERRRDLGPLDTHVEEMEANAALMAAAPDLHAAATAALECPCRGSGRYPKPCPDPQCGDSTWDHDCELGVVICTHPTLQAAVEKAVPR